VPALAQSGWPAPAAPGLQRFVIPPASPATVAVPSQRKADIPPPQKAGPAPVGAAGAAAAGLAEGGLAAGAPLGLRAVGAGATAVSGSGSSATVTTR
jgi:hypothetical protein